MITGVARNAEYLTGLGTGVEMKEEDGTRTNDQDRNRTRTEAGYLDKGLCSTNLRTEATWQRGQGTGA